MIVFPKSKKVKLLTILILIFHLTPCYTYAQDNWTERDWVNYAKAQDNAYDFSVKSTNAVFADKNYRFRDSIAALDVFSPIVINGIKYKETDGKPPVLNGTIRYYYSNGKLASEKSFNNNKADGKEIYYSPTCKISKRINFKEGLEDTSLQFYSNGNIYLKRIREGGKAKDDFVYWPDGSVASKTYHLQNSKFKEEKEFVPFKNSVQTVFVNKTYKTEYFNKKGEVIDYAKYSELMAIENLQLEDLPKPPRGTDLTDDEAIKKYFYLEERMRRKFDKEGIIFGNLTNDVKDTSYESIGNKIDYFRFQVHPLFPSTQLLDTIWYPNKNGFYRLGEHSKGQLNGELNYFYPDNKILAKAFFKEGLIDGNFVIFYPNGNVSEKEKYKLCNQIDTSYIYTLEGKLEEMKIWSDSGKYKQTTYWEDGKITQQIENCSGKQLQIGRRKDGKYVNATDIKSNYYYDKKGEEITEEKFRKLYPGVLQELHQTQVRF
jgi:antitoxin component YwqK of YwqJK toxin-antitoxin module